MEGVGCRDGEGNRKKQERSYNNNNNNSIVEVEKVKKDLTIAPIKSDDIQKVFIKVDL